MICTFRDSIKVGSCLILPVFFGETERVRANVGCGSAPWGYDMHTSRYAVLTQVNDKAWRLDSLIPPSRGVKTVKSHPELGALTAGFRHTFMSPSRYHLAAMLLEYNLNKSGFKLLENWILYRLWKGPWNTSNNL